MYNFIQMGKVSSQLQRCEIFLHNLDRVQFLCLGAKFGNSKVQCKQLLETFHAGSRTAVYGKGPNHKMHFRNFRNTAQCKMDFDLSIPCSLQNEYA